MKMLVDTNVLSQVTRSNGEERVVEWIARNFEGLRVPSLVVSELLFGAHKLADADQRRRLIGVTEALLLRCAGKFVAFDEHDAMLHGRLSGDAMRLGRTRPQSDSMLAAMAMNRGMSVATRNVRHFAGLDLTVVNPWDD